MNNETNTNKNVRPQETYSQDYLNRKSIIREYRKENAQAIREYMREYMREYYKDPSKAEAHKHRCFWNAVKAAIKKNKVTDRLRTKFLLTTGTTLQSWMIKNASLLSGWINGELEIDHIVPLLVCISAKITKPNYHTNVRLVTPQVNSVWCDVFFEKELETLKSEITSYENKNIQ